MTASAPSSLGRVVVVTRKTPLQALQERHGTITQARFYLESRGQSIRDYQEGHERLTAGLNQVLGSIPPDQRRVVIERADLDRFLFAPDDLVLIVGQDGLVPNTAKYLQGQVTIGINPDPDRYDGILCPHRPQITPKLLAWVQHPQGRDFHVQTRIMAQVQREDGQRLLALNEVFIGHRTHQSARYILNLAGQSEPQSSSGIICATGTGCTGWARSILLQRNLGIMPPNPQQQQLLWFVREPFPSVSTGTQMSFGVLDPRTSLSVTSAMADNGVIFADGMETDALEFVSGQQATLSISDYALALVMPAVASPTATPRPPSPPDKRPMTPRSNRPAVPPAMRPVSTSRSPGRRFKKN